MSVCLPIGARTCSIFGNKKSDYFMITWANWVLAYSSIGTI